MKNPLRRTWHVRQVRRAMAAGAAALALTSVGTAWAADAQADPIYFDICPSGISGVASEDTSCAFADAVRASWYSQPGSTVYAVSPVTGKFYTMQCSLTWTTAWGSYTKRCVGINDSGAVLVTYAS